MLTPKPFFRFAPRQWLRWAAGRLGVGERYDIITLDLKPEYLDEAKELPNEKIMIDSVFAFDDTKNAYERLVRKKLYLLESWSTF